MIYPTLAHFRHFSHFRHFYPLFSILTNKPNFMRFSPENDDLTKNKPNSNPIQSQFDERPKLMQSVYIQRIMKKNADMGPKKQTQNKPNLSKGKK